MARKTVGFLSVVLVITMLLAAATQGAPVVGLGRIAINASPTNVGFVDVMLTPTTSLGVGYLNVAVDRNGDGLDAGDWLVFNSEIPLQPTDFGGNPATFSSTFDLSAITLSGTYTVHASFDLSSRSLTDFTGLASTSNVFFGTYDIGDLQDGINSGLDAGVGGSGTQNGSPLSPIGSALSPQATIIGRVRHDTPGIKQKKNECAPTSAAQSLFWLQKRHPGALGGKLPGQDDLIDQMKKAMKWDHSGISPGDFEPGKKKVIEDLKLDKLIVTKKGGQFDGTGTFDFVKKEIEAGEDVELRIQYKKADGSPDGGHWVTAVGWFDDGTKKKLYFKDPLTGGDTIDEYELVGTQMKNYKYGDRAYISFAVSQSVIPEPGTMALFGIGVLAPALAAWRRRKG